MAKYVFKITLLGDASVGKTSLRHTFMGDKFHNNHLPTIGADFSLNKITLGEDNVEFQIWDIAGQPKFERIRDQFYGGAKGAVVVFDLTNHTSFDHIDDWINHFFDNNGIGAVPVYLLGNKSDLERKISKDEIDKYVEELENRLKYNVEYFETSAKTGDNVDEAFLAFADELRQVSLSTLN